MHNKQVNDVNLIHAIKNMLDYALKKEQESFEVPDAHQKLVLERFDNVGDNPDRLLDWEYTCSDITPSRSLNKIIPFDILTITVLRALWLEVKP